MIVSGFYIFVCTFKQFFQNPLWTEASVMLRYIQSIELRFTNTVTKADSSQQSQLENTNMLKKAKILFFVQLFFKMCAGIGNHGASFLSEIFERNSPAQKYYTIQHGYTCFIRRVRTFQAPMGPFLVQDYSKTCFRTYQYVQSQD